MHSPFDSYAGSTGSAVYAELKRQIVSLELPPGTVLSEKEMSLSFQVSRTPVRESFVRLAQEELVVVLPQRGTRVSLIDPALVEEARFVREQLERAIVRLACEHFPADSLNRLEQNMEQQRQCLQDENDKRMMELDEDFHRLLFEGCSKLGAWAVIQQMNAHLNRSRMLWLTADPHWESLYEQHLSILQSIRNKDAGQGDRIMTEHLRLIISNLDVLRAKYPDYFKSDSGKPNIIRG